MPSSPDIVPQVRAKLQGSANVSNKWFSDVDAVELEQLTESSGEVYATERSGHHARSHGASAGGLELTKENLLRHQACIESQEAARAEITLNAQIEKDEDVEMPTALEQQLNQPDGSERSSGASEDWDATLERLSCMMRKASYLQFARDIDIEGLRLELDARSFEALQKLGSSKREVLRPLQQKLDQLCPQIGVFCSKERKRRCAGWQRTRWSAMRQNSRRMLHTFELDSTRRRR